MCSHMSSKTRCSFQHFITYFANKAFILFNINTPVKTSQHKSIKSCCKHIWIASSYDLLEADITKFHSHLSIVE